MCERKLETEQRLQHIDLISPSGHSRVSFTFSWAAQPESRGPSFLLSAVLSTASCLWLIWSPTQSGVPRAPSAGWWLSLPHLVSNSSELQLTDFLSSPSYIIVQSPTQSLEWHVWSSSSGNNCHAVHRSLSSGASVYECTIYSAKPAYAISSHNCHRNVSLLYGASLWNGMFGRVEGQYTTIAMSPINYILKKCTGKYKLHKTERKKSTT